MSTVISVENLGKRYSLGAGGRSNERYTALRDVIANKARSFFHKPKSTPLSGSEPQVSSDFWALKDVSFEIKQGEVVGIIGRNGAGKSTLLKILSRITDPTEGRIKIKGRVASLLEVGTGFHPELTGRENIYLNGAILGMSRAEIKQKFDEIVAFAEVEKFLDTPVKRYSSGMYVRLAFAVAAHLEPEILIVDEVLAVGDAQFQKKCLGKMNEVARGGRTVLFVSHSITSLRSLCHTGLCLNAGRVICQTDIGSAIEFYLGAQASAVSELSYSDRTTPENQRMHISGFSIEGTDGKPVLRINPLEPLVLRLEVTAKRVATAGVNIRIRSRSGYVYWLDSDALQRRQYTFPVGCSTVVCRLDPLRLTVGSYVLDLALTVHNQEWIDDFRDACEFQIVQFDPCGSGFDLTEAFSYVHLPHSWEELVSTNSEPQRNAP